MLKLALNKSMRASDDQQGINKLWPYFQSMLILALECFYYSFAGQ